MPNPTRSFDGAVGRARRSRSRRRPEKRSRLGSKLRRCSPKTLPTAAWIEPSSHGAMGHRYCERGDRGAPVDEPARHQKPGHRRVSPERDELGERDGRGAPSGSAKSAGHREAEDPPVIVEVEEAAGGGAVADPARAGRLPDVAPLLRRRARRGPRTRAPADGARVERERAAWLYSARVAALEAVGQRERARPPPLARRSGPPP